MGKLFGTDGIRGVANQYPITPEIALKVGKAVALFVLDNKLQNVYIHLLIGGDFHFLLF